MPPRHVDLASMELVLSILFWSCLVLLVYVYAGYAVILYGLSRVLEVKHTPDDDYTPPVTILFSAHNEEDVLPGKIESLKRLKYPHERLQILAASDASSDRTADLLLTDEAIECHVLENHVGKNAALNQLLPKATGEILFYTDANTLLHPEALRKAIRHFRDERTGAVVGQLIFTLEKDWNPVGRGTGLYWKYENALKRAESRLGRVLVGGGSLLSVRRSLINTLDTRIANDLEIPARVGAKGYYVFFEEECQGSEKPHHGIHEELQRTSRIVARGLRGFMVLLPVMLRTPLRLWEFLSHKFLRWFTLPYLFILLFGGFFMMDQLIPHIIVWGNLLFLLMALIGFFFLERHATPVWMRPFTLCAQFCLMHVAALWGILRALLGKAPATWKVPESTRK